MGRYLLRPLALRSYPRAPSREPCGLFPLDSTFHKLLDTFGELFGIGFQECLFDSPQYTVVLKAYQKVHNQSDPVLTLDDLWLFTVYNENVTGGAFLGYLVLDLYQRDGKTLGGKQSRFSTASHLSSSSYNHHSCTISNIGK